MRKLDTNAQAKKDLKTIYRIQAFGCILVFIGFLMLVGIAGSIEMDENVPAVIIILSISISVIGMLMANLLSILKVIFNPQKNAQFKRNVKRSLQESANEIKQEAGMLVFLLVATIICIMIILL